MITADKIQLSGIITEQNKSLEIKGSKIVVTLRSEGTSALLTQTQMDKITITDSEINSSVFSRQSSGGLINMSQAELVIKTTLVELAVVGEQLVTENVP